MTDISSSLFTVGASDWSIQQIQTLLFTQNSILATALMTYNLVFTALAGLMVMAFLGKAMVDTAHLGEVLGKVSTVWAPARIVIGTALIVPLTQTYGLNAGQMAAVEAAKLGIAAASNIWTNVAAQMPYATVAPVVPSVRTAAAKIFLAEVCKEIENVLSVDGQSPAVIERPINATTLTSTTGRQYQTAYTGWSLDGDPARGGVTAQCGAVSVTNPASINISAQNAAGGATSIPDQTAAVFTAHSTATEALMAALDTPAKQIAAAVMPPYSVKMTTISSSGLQQALQQYETTVSQALATAAASQGQSSGTGGSSTNPYAGQGFATAGAYGIQLTLASEHLMGAAEALPTVAEPKWDWWGSKDADEIKGMRAAMNWWTQVEGNFDTESQQLMTVGSSDVEPLRHVFDPAKLSTLYGFLLDENALNTNPFGELVALGHMLVGTFWSVVGSWVALKMAAFGAGKGWLAAVPGVANVAGAAQGALDGVGVVFWLMALAVLSAGGTLAYILPMIPAIYWMFAVARYFLRLMLTVLAAPAWGLSHLNMEEGEGLGQRSRSGYHILIELVLRPVVLVLALVVGFELLNIYGSLYSITFLPAIRNALMGHYGGATGFVVYVVLGAATMFKLCTLSFSAINNGVNFVMALGGFGAIGEDGAPEGDAQGAVQATGAASHQIGQIVGTGVVKAPNERQASSATADARRAERVLDSEVHGAVNSIAPGPSDPGGDA